MAQKLLLFWRKPARRCWWEGVELDNVEGVEGKLKVWIRRVWTLEMVSLPQSTSHSRTGTDRLSRVSSACGDYGNQQIDDTRCVGVGFRFICDTRKQCLRWGFFPLLYV